MDPSLPPAFPESWVASNPERMPAGTAASVVKPLVARCFYIPWYSGDCGTHLTGHPLCIGDLRNPQIVSGLQIEP